MSHINWKIFTDSKSQAGAEKTLDLRPGGRWLYHPSGYLKVLAMNRASTYKVKQMNEFNLLMGIQNNDVQGNK